MKKSTILLAILALALMTAPAMATGLLSNWNFETYASGTYLDSGWHANGYITAATNNTPTADRHWAQSNSTSHLGTIYQVVDASIGNPGWIADGTGESFTLSFNYTAPDGTTAKYGVYVWDSDTPMVAFDPSNPTNSYWTAVTDGSSGLVTLANNTSNTIPDAHAYTTGLISLDGECLELDQPQYFAILLEVESHYSSGMKNAGFDDVCFTTCCDPAPPVPVPPSALLLGSGLLGLGILRFRKGTCC
ncbi:MAG: hypothetical protein ACYC6G_05870 [Desulfobaccales bacterium]